jgi:hypothetical protein
VSTPVAIIGAGLSAAALGTGVIFAFSARSYYDSADEIAKDIEAEADKEGLQSRGICNPEPGSIPADPESGFPGACQKYQDRVDTADKYKTYATVGFIAGGALAAGTLVYVLVPTLQGGSSTEQADRGVKTRLIPIVGPEHQGLVLQGSF